MQITKSAVDWPSLMGAFAHEIRTPLATANMVLQLCAMSARDDGTVELDAELVGMLNQSVADLKELAESLQELTRLARGRELVMPGVLPVNQLMLAVDEASAEISITYGQLPDVGAAVDEPRAIAAVTEIAAAANRAGAHTGTVSMHCTATDHLRLEFASLRLEGNPADPDESGVSDAAILGFPFYHAAQVVEAIGGSVAAERRGGGCRILVTLPLAGE